MSNAGHHSDSDIDGDIDFDFFDTTKEPPVSKVSPKASKCSSIASKNPKSDRLSDDSDSRPSSGSVTRVSVRKIEAKLPVLTTSHDYSDSFESGSESEAENEAVKEQQKPKQVVKINRKTRGSQRNACENSERQKYVTSTKSQPTSKARPHKAESSLSSDESSDISTVSDTDSDVTSVSPLGSPGRRAGRDMYDMRELSKLGKPPRSPMHKETVSYNKSSLSKASKVKADDNKLDQLLNADSDTMDLQLLMQAVLEMEEDRELRQRQQRRVFIPVPKTKPQAKMNQTFSNDKVRTIDRENQRLMQRIMRMTREAQTAKTKAKKQKCTTREPPKLTPSAVNRVNEQRRIEQDNRAMLKRLQGTRATKELQRDKLLTSYSSALVAGVSVADVHLPKARASLHASYSATSIASSVEGSSREDSREDSMMDGAMGIKPRARPISAKSTTSMMSTGSIRSTFAQSSKKVAASGGARAQWDNGW